ncbi:MAG: Z1 domain-containing protein, partial [bacterium]
MSTTIEILKSIRPELRWVPEQGEFTTEFVARKCEEWGLQPSELEPVVLEAQTILGRCAPPTEMDGNSTGLVVGYVQSGKTLSFTTVMSLARDNGFQLVILIAGTAINLKNQSERRLFDDLG